MALSSQTPPQARGPLVPAHIELRGGELVWDAVTISHRADPRRMLDAFVRIKDADGVLRFARRYGPLLLCSRGEHLGRDHRGEGCALDVGPPWDRGVESIEHWMRWVREARAIMRIRGRRISHRYEVEFCTDGRDTGA